MGAMAESAGEAVSVDKSLGWPVRPPLASLARTRDAARFLVVGLTGVGVNQALLILLASGIGIDYLLAAVLATQGSTTWNFIGIERWAFAGRGLASAGRLRRYVAYSAVNNGSLLLRLPLLWALTELVGIHYTSSNLLTLVILFVLRFVLSDGWIWRKPAARSYAVATTTTTQTGESPTTPAHRPVAVGPGWSAGYQYDVAGILRIDSEVELPELVAFRAVSPTPPDIRIRWGRVGAMPCGHIRLVRDGERLTYREHLGILGSNFSVTMGPPIEVVASPLLALSRHVLYTNVIEALLRFVLVSKGYVLLHSACIARDGRAVLLSAQTDTGKTSTVVQLVREHGYQFLSDDMVIIDPRGLAHRFPKPMTLSYHTMSSIAGVPLAPARRAALAVQSRVHSKSGRTFGRTLGTLNIPIMSVNSIVQVVVPPPKFCIDSLMPVEIIESARIAQVFLMERGEPLRERVKPAAALNQLIENTDDAYGFPPFGSFAPQIRLGADDYLDLRRKERTLLARALRGVEIWRMRVPGHEWAELLPSMMEAGPNGDAVESRAAQHAGRVALPTVPDSLWPDTQVPGDEPGLGVCPTEAGAGSASRARP